MNHGRKMKKLVTKKIISVIVSLIFVLASSTVSYAGETFEEGTPLILDNVEVWDNGFVCVTEEIQTSVETNMQDALRAYPEKENTVTFAHKIFDRNGILQATFYATVTGVYDQTNRDSFITNVSGYFTGTFAHDFSYTVAYTGDLGRANIFFNGQFLSCITYSIAANGKISFS